MPARSGAASDRDLGTTGHRKTIDWMGARVKSLADLFPSPLRAVCIGINPAPISVEAGHYYQGRQGQRFFARLRQAGVLPEVTSGYEDDAAVAGGFGFTDVVKRPTASADELTADELRHGAKLLAEKLRALDAPVLLFPFKKAAVALVGRFDGNGWITRDFEGSRLFVMPGPYESSTTASATIATLGSGLR